MQKRSLLRLKALPVTLILLFNCHTYLAAQEDDIFSELDNITEEGNHEVIAAFKSTRLMIGQSIERVRKDQLHFRISHVFQKILGVQNFFGLDNLNNMHLSFEYGLSDFIQVGLARENVDRTYSGTLKLSLFRQKTGKNSFPLSMSYYLSVDIKSIDYTPMERDLYLEGRFDYVNQLLIGSKITDEISLQIAPTWVHRNLTDSVDEPNEIYSVGAGGRYLFSRSMSVNAEYYYTIPTFDAHDATKNMFTIGFDLETGGHVFQLYFTNANFLHPGKFALNQNGNFFKDRDINFGFSMLRAFNM